MKRIHLLRATGMRDTPASLDVVVNVDQEHEKLGGKSAILDRLTSLAGGVVGVVASLLTSVGAAKEVASKSTLEATSLVVWASVAASVLAVAGAGLLVRRNRRQAMDLAPPTSAQIDPQLDVLLKQLMPSLDPSGMLEFDSQDRDSSTRPRPHAVPSHPRSDP